MKNSSTTKYTVAYSTCCRWDGHLLKVLAINFVGWGYEFGGQKTT